MTILLWAIPLFLLTILVEWRLLHDKENVRGYGLADTLASLSMGIGNLVFMFSSKAVVFGLLTGLYAFRFWSWDSSSAGYWIALFFADDFFYYCFHRTSHGVRFFWAAHVNHHSSMHYNLSTALRQSWTGPLISWVFWIPLPLMGFEPLHVLLAQSWNLLYQYWVHTESVERLGPLEWIFNTASHHRVHHGSDPLYLDRNHGGILIVWDRLFGTFQAEDFRPAYGLTTNIDTFHPVQIAFHEWVALMHDIRNADTWGNRLGFLVQPPGWRPDGNGKLSRDLREEWLENSRK